MEEIAEELQKQIDQLRKQIKDILTQLANTSSEEVISILQKQLDDLNSKLEDCYKKLDKLSSELQQEFRQKLDQLNKELANAHLAILQRLLQLEQEAQNRTISLCIGNLRDGLINTAIASFKHIKNPKEHITHIINESYQSDANCDSIVDFVNDLEVDGNDQTLQNEVKAIGYSASDGIFSKSNFASKLDSTCRLRLAWNVNKLISKLTSSEENASKLLKSLDDSFPQSIHKFTTFILPMVQLIDANELESCITKEPFPGDEYSMRVENTLWIVESSDGKSFMFVNKFHYKEPDRIDHPMISFGSRGDSSLLRVMLAKDKYTSLANQPKALWRVVPVSNESFYLESKQNPNEFLTPVDNFSGGSGCVSWYPSALCPKRCNNLTLRDVPYHFKIYETVQ